VVLRLGDRGSQVRQLQEKLSSLGYLKGHSDGIFGNNTRNAVIAFQRDHKLSADGIVGTMTLKALGFFPETTPVETIPGSPVSGSLEFYPDAIQIRPNLPTRGNFAGGYPKGVVVHYTAGRFGSLQKAIDMVESGRKNGYSYWAISSQGQVLQTTSVTRWGYHAGESAWKNALVGRLYGTVSDDLLGIEITCAGLLKKKDGKFFADYGEEIPAADVRYVTEAEYGCPTGYYHKYTKEQEAALISVILWLKKNDTKGIFSFDDVLGHHEVAGKRGIGYFRKSDPGGSLSMSMDQFRQLLKDRWAKR